MILLKKFLIILIPVIFLGCDTGRLDREKIKLQKEVDIIKAQFDSAKKNIDTLRHEIDSITRMYKIDSIKIDSTLKNINPLK